MGASQRMAQLFGIVFVVIAVWGFFVSGGSMDASVTTAPRILGLFPVNLIHNLAHLLFGIWGLAAMRDAVASRNYLLWAGVAYLGLMVLGFFLPSLFGIMPIGGNDIWLHALLGVVLLFAGLTARRELPTHDAI